MLRFLLRPRVRRAFHLDSRTPGRLAAELDDELRLHLELRGAQLVRQGLDPAAAEREALRRFGAPTYAEARRRLAHTRAHAERTMHRRDRLDAFRQDLRYTLRQLVRAPGFTVAVVATLGLALGATATMFGIIDRLLLQPLPHLRAPHELGRVFFSLTRGGDATQHFPHVSYPMFGELRERPGAPYEVAALSRRELPVAAPGDGARLRPVELVSPGYFSLLGAVPALGRLLTDAEAHHESGARGVVVSHGFWQRELGADPGALGRTVLVRGTPYTVVGVAPRGFTGARPEAADLWLPMAALHDGSEAARRRFSSPNNVSWELVARLRPGATVEQASAVIAAAYAAHQQSLAGDAGDAGPDDRYRFGATVAPLSAAVGRDMRRTPEATVAVWLGGTALVLLLVACANVASLLLLRAERRHREFAVRVALGMGRGRLLAQLLTESLTLAVLGLAAALALTAWGGAALRVLLLPDADPDAWGMDGRLLLAAGAATALTVLLTGLAPAARARRLAHGAALGGGAGGPGGPARRSRLQRPLLVAQVGLSALLLVGAGLFLRSLHNVRHEDLGMRTDRVLAVSVDAAAARWTAAEAADFLARAAARVPAVPGVAQVALVENAPLLSVGSMSVGLPAADSALLPRDGAPRGFVHGSAVGPGYFETLGMRLVQGRLLDERDRAAAPPAAVVNEAFARAHWPGRSPLGRCLYVNGGPACTTVVGVVRDARLFRLREEPQPLLYVPLAQRGPASRARALLVRTTGDAERHAARVQAAVHDLAPEIPFVDVRALQSVIDPQARPWRIGATMFTVFGGFAFLLAALGLYGAIAYGVTMRTREIGVRLALGAPARRVAAQVLREGAALAAAGLAVGLGLALLGSARIADLLFDVSPRDAAVYASVALLLLACALLACLVPARRATRVDPVIALKSE